jgi:hypothetical protein
MDFDSFLAQLPHLESHGEHLLLYLQPPEFQLLRAVTRYSALSAIPTPPPLSAALI